MSEIDYLEEARSLGEIRCADSVEYSISDILSALIAITVELRKFNDREERKERGMTIPSEVDDEA